MPREVKIGGLRATWTGQNDDYLKKADQTVRSMATQRRAVRTLTREFGKLRTGVRRVVTALGAQVGGAVGFLAISHAVAGAQRRTAEFGATLYEVSASVGVTVDQLQRLRRAFEGDGVAAEKTDLALQRLARTAAEAQHLESYARLFRSLRIDLDAWRESGASTYELLLQVADGLAIMENQVDRVNVAQQLLGRSGARLLPALTLGRAAFEDLAQSLSSVGFLTDKQAGDLKVLAQSYANRADAIQFAARRVQAENAAYFLALNQWMQRTGVALREGLGATVRWFGQNAEIARLALAGFVALLLRGRVIAFAKSLLAVAVAMKALAASTSAAVAAMTLLKRVLVFAGVFAAIAVGVDFLLQKFGILTGGASDAAAELERLRKEMETAGQTAQLALQEAVDEVAGSGVQLGDVVTLRVQAELQYDPTELREYTRANDQIERDLQRRAELEGLAGRERELALAALRARTEYEESAIATAYAEVDARARLVQLEQFLQETIAAGHELDIQAVRSAVRQQELALIIAEKNRVTVQETIGLREQEIARNNRLLAQRLELNDLERDARERVQTLKGAYQQVGQAVGQFAKQAILDFRNIRDSVKNLLQAVLDVVAELLIVRPIAEAISRGLGGAFGVQGFAAGGRPPVGVPVLVGERGPELFVPDVAGSVVANHDLRTGGQQVVVNFAPVVQVSDRRAVDLALAEAYPAFEAQVKGAVVRDMGRPSPLRRAIRP